MAKSLSSNWKQLQAKFREGEEQSQGVKRNGDELADTDDEPATTKNVKKRKLSARPNVKTTMGEVQSTVSRPGVSVDLASWADDYDISAEALAEAYGLGKKDASMINTPVKPNAGLTRTTELGKYLAIDCEMVGVGESGRESALARVSIVDFHGRQIYDSFVRPQERVTNWRTFVSGVSAKDMAAARRFEEVQTEVANLLEGRILIGHDIHHDLEALQLDYPKNLIRDTAKFAGFKKYGNGPKPALKVLSREILGLEIQNGQHSSIEDARVAMLLFKRYKSAFDVEAASRAIQPGARKPKAPPTRTKKKTKK